LKLKYYFISFKMENKTTEEEVTVQHLSSMRVS
jgi:hypothetical protein